MFGDSELPGGMGSGAGILKLSSGSLHSDGRVIMTSLIRAVKEGTS